MADVRRRSRPLPRFIQFIRRREQLTKKIEAAERELLEIDRVLMPVLERLCAEEDARRTFCDR